MDWDELLLVRKGLLALNDEVRMLVAMREVPIRETIRREEQTRAGDSV